MIVSVSWPRGSKCQGGSRSEGEREEKEETEERGGGEEQKQTSSKMWYSIAVSFSLIM